MYSSNGLAKVNSGLVNCILNIKHDMKSKEVIVKITIYFCMVCTSVSHWQKKLVFKLEKKLKKIEEPDNFSPSC